MSEDNDDLSPETWQIYGYVVLQKTDNDKWEAEDNDEYSNLPAYEQFKPIAQDRATYLRENGIEARVMALIKEPEYDTPERMDKAKKARHDDGETESNSESNQD